EIGQRGVPARRLDRLELRDDRVVAGFASGDADALVEAHQMRRRVQPDPVAGGEQDRLEHRAARALAVRSADGEHDARHGQAHALRDRAHAVEPEVDRLRMQRLDAREPLGERRRHQAIASLGCLHSIASRRAISSRSWRRSTMQSIAPFSSRNSARWKPSGNFVRTVCSMTRGPAKPISARGSAMTTSPRKQKLADTPPIVGSVSTDRYGSRFSASRAGIAVVLAICLSDSTRSCFRGTSEEVIKSNGTRCSIAACTPRPKRAPNSDPFEPAMKSYEKDPATTGIVRN